ncbi:MAG: TonB-dependent receptor plug domain-containing protein [Chitinophagaceae bacterium]|nr:TonB-dependent receptor plug domain-containing protein [Chitinophagaceae bacterium]
MKKKLGTMMFTVMSFYLQAQVSTYNVGGKIIDQQTQEPLESVSIQINNETALSTKNGTFTFKESFQPGVYELQLTCVGYKSLSKIINVSNAPIDCLIELTKKVSSLLDLEVVSIRSADNAPFTKTNLKKGDIEKLNTGVDLPFILNQTPSVVVNSDAGNGIGYTGISIRGTDASRINVTLNGIPFNDAESQGTFFVDLPDFASSLNSIQIQRGVGTSSNGVGAFGGTINLSTNQFNPKSSVELNNSYGSFNSWKNTVIVNSGIINKHFTIDARLSQIKSDGFIERAKSNLQSFAVSAAYTTEKSSLRFNIFSGKEKTYQAWNGVSENMLSINPRFNVSGTDKSGEPYNNETDNYTQTHYQLFYNKNINEFWDISTALFYTKGFGYYENYKANQKYSNYGLTNPNNSRTDLVRQQWLDNDFYGQLFSAQYKKNKTTLTVGGSWSNYKGLHFGQIIWAANGAVPNGYKYYDVDAKKSDFGFYTKLQQTITTNLDAFIDLQYRMVDYTMNGFRYNPTLNINRTFNFFNPKFGLSYSKNGWQTYLSYAVANKEPNRNDFEASINNQPKAEQLHDIEFGIERKKSNYSFGATVYYMKYKDQLVLTGKINEVGAYTRTNVDKSYRLGIELQGSYIFNHWLNIQSNLTLSRNKINAFSEFIDDYDNGGQKEIKHSNTNIALSPSIISNNILNVNMSKNLQLSFINKYVGKQYLDNTQNESRMLKAFFVQDIRASLNLKNKLFSETLLMFSLNNIFNKMYQPNGYTFSYIAGGSQTTENYYFPMAGTNFNLILNIKM